jgi:hypothetical protein
VLTITGAGTTGPIDTIELLTHGSLYTVEECTVTGGTGGDDATIDVDTVSDGRAVVTVLTITPIVTGYVKTLGAPSGGTGYTTDTGVATTVAPAGGAGLTVDTTAAGGVISNLAIAAPGAGYSVDDVITVTGGNADCTATVTAVGDHGAVLTVEITDPGLGYAIDTAIPTTSNGAGSGCTIDVDANCAGTVTMDFDVSIIADPL